MIAIDDNDHRALQSDGSGKPVEDQGYYTPDISEFHVGFEFEYRNSNAWLKAVFDETMLLVDSFPDPSCEYRVPYLTREQIESLEGWKYVEPENGETLIDNYYSFISEYNSNLKIEFRMRYFDVLHHLSIWSDDTDTTYFYGKIRNLSELKRILKMVL